MSSLFLVRHAQASLFGDDYDRLSDAGVEQARRLGTVLADRGVAFDAVYAGPRERQRRTAEIAREAAAGAGARWPAVEIVEDLDEYRLDVEGVLGRLVAERKDVAAAVAALAGATDPGDRARRFQRALEVAMRLWVTGAIDGDDVEPWPDFRDRAERALGRLTGARGRSQRVLATSSAGTIGAIVGRVLGAPDRTVLELSWTMNNCSISEILFSGDRRNVSRFNAVGHLEDVDLVTFR